MSELGLGTMNFGPNASERDSFEMLDRALDAGVNLIDTADQYGGHLGVGTTESLLGRWLADRGRRDEVVLATKVHEPMSGRPNDRGLSARHIMAACDASLKRLQVDHIDLYQMHHLDRAAPWDEIWQAMETLVAQGKVIYVGCSNFAGWSIAQANEAAKNRHFLGLVSEQSLYNLTERTVELEVIPACESYGLGLLPWSPLAGGLLGGNLTVDAAKRSDGERRQSSGVQQRARGMATQLADWEAFCADVGEEPAVVALAWLMHQPAVTAPLSGPRTMEQLDAAIHATTVRLDAGALSVIDEIFPGPGAAPEAYAW